MLTDSPPDGGVIATGASTERNLRAAHEVARLSSWEWRPATNDVVIFQALPESTLSAGMTAGVDELLAQMPVAQQEEMTRDFASLAAGVCNQLTRRFPYELPHGEAWLETRCEVVRDASGEVVGVRGTTQDVTGQENESRLVMRDRQFLQSTLDSLPYSIAVLGAGGEILLTNRTWKAFAAENGGDPSNCEGNYLTACDSGAGEESAAAAAEGLRILLADPASPEFTMEYPCHSPERERWYALRASRYEGPGEAAVVLSHVEVTDRRNAERRLRFQASLVDAANASVAATDGDGRVTHWSPGAQALYGWTSTEATGKLLRELILPAEGGGLLEPTHEPDGRSEENLLVSRKDGSTFPVCVRSSPFTEAEGGRAGRILISMDLSARVSARRQLMTAHNHLRAVTDSMAEGLFTLDGEGRVTYLNRATEKLLGWSRHDVIGRVWDEVSRSRGRELPETSLGSRSISVTQGALGVVHVDDHAFMHRRGYELPVAFTASPMEADDGPGGCVVVFTDISERKSRERRLRDERDKGLVIDRIAGALSEDRLLLYGQPILNLRTKEVTQTELLLRMVEPGGEVCAPGTFLQIAEESGQIREIDRWVIARGLKMAAAGLNVQLNISARSIGDLSVMEHIERCFEQHGTDPGNVVFEMTETAILADEVAAIAFAERLHELGATLALDDFGTGYGSFTYLKRLAIDYLKIDMEFVRDIATNPASRHVVSAIVALARSFGLLTIGEGVEDSETKDVLLELGVDFAQGYHIGRPTATEQSSEDAVPAVPRQTSTALTEETAWSETTAI